MWSRVRSLFLLLLLAACQSTHAPIKVVTPPAEPLPSVTQPRLPSWETASEFSDLPNWSSVPLEAAVSAFKRSCEKFAGRDLSADLSSAAPWAGKVGDWAVPCGQMSAARSDEEARSLFEQAFVPIEVIAPDGESRFTGYFEPTYEARRTPTPPFTEPVPALPDDLVPNGDSPLQRLPNGKTRPYPDRAQITTSGVKAIAYAHPADVFFLQIQGSGRLKFPDGTTMRAVYAAHNGHRFHSTANWLIETGRIKRGEASMQGIRAWMDRAGAAETRMAMNQNPRFVFFRAEAEGDPSLGPAGAQGVPLTPLGSMAVDTSLHPLGVPMFVETSAPGLGGEWSGVLVAQDTGGAIKGAVRGDIYFGTGPEAGDRAGTTNAPGRLWVFLPRDVARRMRADGYASLDTAPPAP
ncbi:MAG TPA: MltA domain-containing protein [Hyphomonas sp.]|nr:MltA domain-containing protein [Hyphomonas sp.]